MEKKTAVFFCVFLILSVVTLLPTVNAQGMERIKAKDKYAQGMAKYCEKHIIPRYEAYVFRHMEKSEVDEITTGITDEFLTLTNGRTTTELTIMLYLVSLIIAFFYLMFGSNAFSFSACVATTFVVMFIPIMIMSFSFAIVESGLFGLSGILAIFDMETIGDLIHLYGIVGCFFIFSVLLPVFLLLYLLAIPIITVADMVLFFSIVLMYIDENFPKP